MYIIDEISAQHIMHPRQQSQIQNLAIESLCGSLLVSIISLDVENSLRPINGKDIIVTADLGLLCPVQRFLEIEALL
jgi:hypothetical protein